MALDEIASYIYHCEMFQHSIDAIALMQLAILVSPLVFADVGFTVLAAYLRKPRWIAVKWALACAATVAVDLLAIPRLGARGAILGYATSGALAVLAGIVTWAYARRTQQS